MLLNVFNNRNFFSCTVRRQAIHINAVCLCDGRQDIFLTGEVVDRQGSLARSQVLAVVHCHFRRQLPFDGGSPLELVINLHTQAPACFFKLCSYIGRPFSCMSSELSHLRNIRGGERKNIVIHFLKEKCLSGIKPPQEHKVNWTQKTDNEHLPIGITLLCPGYSL